MKTNMVKMSLVAVMVLSSGAYAGMIKTNADLNDATVLDNQQFGFGGWNLDNVNVKIVSTDDLMFLFRIQIFMKLLVCTRRWKLVCLLNQKFITL